FHSRVYVQREKGRVLKAYREATGLNRLEAEHMRRAGHEEWLLGTREIGGLEVLELRYFPGRPACDADFRPVLPRLAQTLERLHSIRGPRAVDVRAVVERAERFHAALGDERLDSLLAAVREAAEGGVLDAPTSLCHLDLWCANILCAASGEVLVVDWGRSGWDDPARDVAILKTGTLDALPAEEAEATALAMAGGEGVRERLPAYVALQTLNDLDWYRRHEPRELEAELGRKLPRALRLLEGQR
ncbi:MAG TPA: phosphotransferase, partial [Deinococcales bacterium]|nr:phosphotransferase [Deinococcales bacterium]